MRLSDFKMLTFDTYGTLIDWESGIYNALEPLLDKLPLRLDRDEVLELFAEFEMQQQADTPAQVYSSLLAEVSKSIAKNGRSSSAMRKRRPSDVRSSIGPSSRIRLPA